MKVILKENDQGKLTPHEGKREETCAVDRSIKKNNSCSHKKFRAEGMAHS